MVDGKQRLTSILRFIGQHPAARKRVKEADELHPGANLQKHFDENYKKFRRTWKNIVGVSLTDKLEAEYYFPFRLAQSSKALRGPLEALAGKYYHEIKEQIISVADGQEEVINVFEYASDYKIPLIEYTEASRNPGEGADAYLGDQLFDYHTHHENPPVRVPGEPSWRPRGAPGLVLFHLIRSPGQQKDAVAIGLGIPLGGPDHIAALRSG